ncbi:MAG: SH3 domain-containing protein [Paracoccaceae bacterium]|nr:SH3 domain-containing protein [Paracoccaceae bacterium]MDP7186301.1 SH3 domain-containing protein [Paracoccaceae bacterium]
MRRGFLAILLVTLVSATGVAWAQERGSVTNLPIPRFASIKAHEANVRRGPNLTYRVDWVFKARELPVEIIGEYGLWRRIRDKDGVGGWIHHALLSGVRTGIVEGESVALRTRPEVDAPMRAVLERDVIGRIQSCNGTWCRFSAGGYRGWILQTEIWGTAPGEVIE